MFTFACQHHTTSTCYSCSKFSVNLWGSCWCEWKQVFLIIPAPHEYNITPVFFLPFCWFVCISCFSPVTKKLNQVCADDVTVHGQCLPGPSINKSYSYTGFSGFIVNCNKTSGEVHRLKYNKSSYTAVILLWRTNFLSVSLTHTVKTEACKS